jgi:phosphoribosylanthranilate isomerase
MKQQVAVKVCGITRIEDALKAVELGARYMGFIFAPQSPRVIDPEDAGRIIKELPDTVIPVGVFVNAPRDRVLDVIDTSGIKMVQLHGYESPEYCTSFGSFPVMKAFRVKQPFNLEDVLQYPCSLYLLDSYNKKLAGGTGSTFDWELAQPVAQNVNVMLAGGLTPENIVDAVETVKPYGVDVNSGVEDEPGIKSHSKLERIFANLGQSGYHRIPQPERSI